jgi:hypothetical protein
MRRHFALVLAILLPAVQALPAFADEPAECRVADDLIEADFPLPQVTRALAAKRFNILVVGAGSSVLPGANGVRNAYPARLERALTEKLPGVSIKVTTDVKSRRTAADMVATLPAALSGAKPALVVWQTGTVDAMLGVDPDEFSATLERGIAMLHTTGADVVLVNAQYSPRTESLIALSTYEDDMRWIAVQQEIPLFDRFSIMKLWSESGTFDLSSATKKLEIAERIHNCIGRLLADLIIKSSQPAAK